MTTLKVGDKVQFNIPDDNYFEDNAWIIGEIYIDTENNSIEIKSTDKKCWISIPVECELNSLKKL